MDSYGNMETDMGVLWANANQIPTKHMLKISTIFWIRVNDEEATVATLKSSYILKHRWAVERKNNSWH